VDIVNYSNVHHRNSGLYQKECSQLVPVLLWILLNCVYSSQCQLSGSVILRLGLFSVCF